MAITSVLTAVLDTAKGLVGSAAWGPLVNVSRTEVLSLFKQIQNGQMAITDTDGGRAVYGRPVVDGVVPTPNVELRVNRESFWVRLALFADMVRIVGPAVVDALLKLRGRGSPKAICWER